MSTLHLGSLGRKCAQALSIAWAVVGVGCHCLPGDCGPSDWVLPVQSCEPDSSGGDHWCPHHHCRHHGGVALELGLKVVAIPVLLPHVGVRHLGPELGAPIEFAGAVVEPAPTREPQPEVLVPLPTQASFDRTGGIVPAQPMPGAAVERASFLDTDR